MLYIVDKFRTEWPWHVNSSVPVRAQDVIEVQADGDELDYIRSRVTMNNDSNRRVIRWFGDDAKFIVANALL